MRRYSFGSDEGGPVFYDDLRRGRGRGRGGYREQREDRLVDEGYPPYRGRSGRGRDNFYHDDFHIERRISDFDHRGMEYRGRGRENLRGGDFRGRDFRGRGEIRGRGEFRGRGDFRGRGEFRGKGDFRGREQMRVRNRDDFFVDKPIHRGSFRGDFPGRR